MISTQVYEFVSAPRVYSVSSAVQATELLGIVGWDQDTRDERINYEISHFDHCLHSEHRFVQAGPYWAIASLANIPASDSGASDNV